MMKLNKSQAKAEVAERTFVLKLKIGGYAAKGCCLPIYNIDTERHLKYGHFASLRGART